MSFKKAPIKFTNPQTDAQFEALTPVDQFLDVPARPGDGKCWRGMISTITPEAAARMVRRGSNLIQRKTSTTAPVTDGTNTETNSATS